MNSDKPIIDLALLKKYYSNEMSDLERNSLERKALEDPFLKEAMDGFDENPGSFDAFYKKHESKLTTKKNYTFVVGLSILIGLMGITLLVSKFNPSTKNLAENHEKIDSLPTVNLENEYQLIPEEIDTLEIIEKTEMITISEVKKKQDQQLTKPVNGEPELIAIEDDETNQDEFGIEKEQISWRRPGQETPTTLYYFDLMVVDYRTIKRTNNNIHYTRHELTGIAADQENGSVERKDLIETEVEIPYMSYLNKTMEYFSKSNFKQALTRFLIIIEQYPADANALFYGGLSYFNLGQYEEAINFFNKVLASDLYIFQEESLWYKTKALLKLNKKAEANLILDELIMRDGFYVQDAIQLKKQIQR